MTDAKEIANDALRGFFTDHVILGQELETALEERDEAWADTEANGDRITELENCLIGIKANLCGYALRKLPQAVSDGLSNDIVRIEAALKGSD